MWAPESETVLNTLVLVRQYQTVQHMPVRGLKLLDNRFFIRDVEGNKMTKQL